MGESGRGFNLEFFMVLNFLYVAVRLKNNPNTIAVSSKKIRMMMIIIIIIRRRRRRRRRRSRSRRSTVQKLGTIIFNNFDFFGFFNFDFLITSKPKLGPLSLMPQAFVFSYRIYRPNFI